MTTWQDMIVADRMTVDNEFSSRVDDSRFSRQEWSLIMTATTFEIEHPEDETNAKLIADTSQLPSIIPELEQVADMGPMGPTRNASKSNSGLLGSIRDALGMRNGRDGSDAEKEKLEDAQALVSAYAKTLQTHLESEGRWSEIRSAAAER